jgi:hypothetical protein
MIEVNMDEALKDNAIAMVKDHKRTCNNPDCGVSTYLLMLLVDKASIKLTKEERMMFI